MHRTISRRPDPMPRHRRWRLLLLVALCCGWALSACAGGSGSSGFDAVTAENNAIDHALESQGCEVNDGLTICASGAATPPPATPTATSSFRPTAPATPTTTQSFPAVTATPSPTGSPAFRSPTPTATGTTQRTHSPTPTATPIPAQPSVDVNLGVTDTIPCQQAGPLQPCVFVLTFQPHGAPAGAAYWVAVRTKNPNRDWLVSPVTDNSAAIAVNPAAADTRYQIAVLLFVHEPAFVPNEVELLSETGADFAFVTALLAAEEIGAP